jgi:alpha-L-arabinofuranosidase
LWIGAVSLLPDDHFFGMRRDVIDLFKTLHPSLLRWPGGNFVRDYEWQQGLLPVEKRPPILATWRSNLPFTHSYDSHDVGTDEFIELCRYLSAEPCITINMNPQTAPAADAAAWVEYCNGKPDTHWGRLRAQRGHEKPYNVRYWFVGNEVWGHWMGRSHTDAATYARRIADYAAAMKKVDPSIVLIASGQGAIAPDQGGPQWDETVLARAGRHFDLLSQHQYAPQVSFGAGPEADEPYSKRMHEAVEGLLPPNPEVEPEYARLSRFAESEMLPLLRDVRGCIDRQLPDRSIGIALDEWNVWRIWFTRPYESGWHDGVTEAAYAAGMLHMFCREAATLKLAMALFFQVINEGGMVVAPFSARLTPRGQVLAMLVVHQNGRLIRIDPPREGMGLDLCASISRDSKALNITMVNRNPWRSQDAELSLGSGLAGAPAPFTVMSTPRLTPYAVFERRTEMLAVDEHGVVKLHLPRYAVALMQIKVPGP